MAAAGLLRADTEEQVDKLSSTYVKTTVAFQQALKERVVEVYLRRRYGEHFAAVELVEKEDLDLVRLVRCPFFFYEYPD